MNRNEKIAKLGNAIRRYRGKYDQRSLKWIKAPAPSALRDVSRWVEQLGLDPRATLEAVQGFKTFPQLNEWLRNLN